MNNIFPDVSHYEPVDFTKFKGSMLITKCTEGISYIDPTFVKVKESCKQNHIKFGAYHFFRCNKSILDQVDHYLKHLGETDLPPILDIETRDTKALDVIKMSIGLWLKTVEEKTGKTPIIYSGESFLKDLKLDDSFTRYPLWLAKYTIVEPPAPKPWSKITWWQYSDSVPFAGIGKCDGNKIISPIG